MPGREVGIIMANVATLTLTRIKYDGETVGSQTDFSISAAGSTTPIKTDIKHGAEKKYTKVVYSGSSDEKNLKIPIEIVASEKDPKTADDASRRKQVVLLAKGKKSDFSVVLDVMEKGDLFKTGNTAHFIFDFHAEYGAAPAPAPAPKPKAKGSSKTTTKKKR